MLIFCFYLDLQIVFPGQFATVMGYEYKGLKYN
jgi:hypothetical protein